MHTPFFAVEIFSTHWVSFTSRESSALALAGDDSHFYYGVGPACASQMLWAFATFTPANRPPAVQTITKSRFIPIHPSRNRTSISQAVNGQNETVRHYSRLAMFRDRGT